MEIFKCVGKQKVDFFSKSDNKQIVGVNFFCVFESDNVEGVMIKKFYISSDKLSDFSYLPLVGEDFKVEYNRYGKVGKFLKV